MHPGRPIPLPRHGGTLLLASALALHAGLAQAAPARRAARAEAAPAPATLADFERLSGAHAQGCAAPLDPRLAALGTPSLRQCAWRQHLDMHYWRALPAAAGSCLPPAASAWQDLAGTGQTRVPAWRGAWSGQAQIAAAASVQQVAALWRLPDGGWAAVVWRWQPSDQAATRAWQQAHWDAVQRMARALDAANPTPPAVPLLQAWLDATADKPRVLDGDRWRWIAGQACLSMRTTDIGPTQLQLPWSRDDARLEQRTGMQVQLARRFPDADWLLPFTLLDPAQPGARGGAQFIAVWQEGASVQGQLWMPLREDGGVVRARIASSLPALPPARARDAARQRAALLERELGALAHAWELRHE